MDTISCNNAETVPTECQSMGARSENDSRFLESSSRTPSRCSGLVNCMTSGSNSSIPPLPLRLTPGADGAAAPMGVTPPTPTPNPPPPNPPIPVVVDPTPGAPTPPILFRVFRLRLKLLAAEFIAELIAEFIAELMDPPPPPMLILPLLLFESKAPIPINDDMDDDPREDAAPMAIDAPNDVALLLLFVPLLTPRPTLFIPGAPTPKLAPPRPLVDPPRGKS